MYTMNDAYNDVKLFNKLAGNLDNPSLDSIDNQLGFCFEELCEAITSFEEGDMSNFVKEVCDLNVVVQGLIQKIAASGVNVEAAMKEVNENNLTKFPRDNGRPIPEVIGQVVVVNAQHNRYMYKDSNGKIKKPPSYQPASMSHVALGNLV